MKLGPTTGKEEKISLLACMVNKQCINHFTVNPTARVRDRARPRIAKFYIKGWW